jgi:glycosyltransferase A (GT-A) superfamily protein (DUF2064 family)
MSGAIAIFVKTPGRSALKTRLAATLGDDFATHWYSLAAGAVAEVAHEAARAHRACAYWAVAEAEALGDPRWAGLAIEPQGEGGLGARMQRVHAALCERHGAAILLGADTPQVDAGLLCRALDWLAAPAPRLAFGPARDGGFWLFGGNRPLRAHDWDSVAYSAPATGAQFRALFEGSGDWLDLPVLGDVDTAADAADCLRALDALPARLPLQDTLRAWMAARLPRHRVPA